MSYDSLINGSSQFSIQNGNIICTTTPGTYASGTFTRLAFYRLEANGTQTMLVNEYSPFKSKNPRYYEWPTDGYEFSVEYSFTSTPDEQIYGTGMQTDHMVNKKGQTIDLLNFNSHLPTPVYMSSKGYAFIWNSAAEGRMEFGPLRTRFTSDVTTLVDYVVISAPQGDYDELQQKLSAATGRAPTPPDWSLGYIHSKLRYQNQTEVELLADNFVKYDIPVSLIVIDYQSWAHQGDWGLDPIYWPDPASMSAYVKNKTGAEMMASLWPSVEDNSVNYMTMQMNGLLAATKTGPGTTDNWSGSYIRNYDATNPEARKFLWETLYQNYYAKGIKNFWLDQDEGGSLGEAWENTAQFGYVNSIPYALPDVLYAAGTQKSIGKLYPWAHQQSVEDGLRNVTETKTGTPCDHLSLSRSGYIGSQRFCSMIWSGDTTAVWQTLSEQVAHGLSAASTGFGWWTLDIGGFQNDPTVSWSNNIDDDRYRELYIRWQQWATFLPFMRNHGARSCNTQHAYSCDNEPWSYGTNNTPIIKSYIELRYTLVPYLRSLFAKFSETGRMIMRPLFVDFSLTDPNISLWTGQNTNFTTQQYMLGPRLLVSPITLPNVTEWQVYLPQTAADGNSTQPWTYWWTNQTYAGGQNVTVPAPLENIPVFYLGTKDDILSGNVF
jgi:alpha-D-xyloside xylohydrolase